MSAPCEICQLPTSMGIHAKCAEQRHTQKLRDQHIQELVEQAYWIFEARRAGRNRFAPQEERGAFKDAVWLLLSQLDEL